MGIAQSILEECAKENLKFAFFRKLSPELLSPYQLDDKTFVECRAVPGAKVTLFYRLDTGLGAETAYKCEPLKEMYQGEQSAENLMSGFVNCSHDLTDHGVCLIDTIGIGINDYDVKRTAEIMREADVVVFLYDGSKHGNLTSDEIDFLKATLFKDKKRPLLPYERMIFAPNKMDCVASTAQIKQILSYDLGNFVPSGSGEWQQLVKNIFPISARYHRLAQVGIANYSAVKDSMTRAELMNNDFEIIQNASFRSGDYKKYLKERSGVNFLVDRIVDILGDIDIDDIIDKYI